MADTAAPSATSAPELSVVVPVNNEADNIVPLVTEIIAALEGGAAYEIVYVDDGSDDGTWGKLSDLADIHPTLRAVHHVARSGQSAAIVTGVRHARGATIVTLDGDGQNDPADIPRLLDVYGARPGGTQLMVTGNRANRRDSGWRRFASRTANNIRGGLLGDQTPDTGCGLKVFSRGAFLEMPAFDHMHRFLPALTIRAGGQVTSVDVGHRPRERGHSKYGVWDRLWVGITDLFGVMWLKRRPTRHSIDRELGR